MSLQAVTAGLLALRGLSLLERLVQGLGQRAVADRLQSGEPLSQPEFEALIDRLLDAARIAAEPSGTTPAPLSEREELIASLVRGERSLTPLLFRTLDADGSGAIEGRELAHLQRLVSQIREALGASAAPQGLRAPP